jgi:hypothetical protein
MTRQREVESAFGIDTRREPAAVAPSREIRAHELRDPRLVRGEVGGGQAFMPLAGSAATEEGAHVFPGPPPRIRRVDGTPLAHSGQARFGRERTGTFR